MAREGRAAFLSERIAGAQHFDIDEVADQTSPFPHMVPSEVDFQEHVGKVSPSSSSLHSSLFFLGCSTLSSLLPHSHHLIHLYQLCVCIY